MSTPQVALEISDGQTLFLSISKLFDYENCPQKYYLKHIKRLHRELNDSNLAFGNTIHDVTEDYLVAHHHSMPFDVDAVFEKHFESRIRSQQIDFGTKWSLDSLYQTGLTLSRQWVNKWPDYGLTLICDPEENPIVNRLLTWDLGHGVVLRGKIDFSGYNRDAEYGILDFKTPSSEDRGEFAILSEQLTAYQGIAEANQELLELPDVSWLSFQQLMKRKVPTKTNAKGPQVLPPNPVPSRTQLQIQSFRDKVLYIAEKIRENHFYTSPKLPHDSPCNLCEYQQYCTTGNLDGLVTKKYQNKHS